MIQRAVYDTMVFFQWAVLPEGRQHRTIKALYDGSIRLCLSAALIDEVRDVLSRPELGARFPALTPVRVDRVLQEAARHADIFQDVLPAFTWLLHPDDDHLFNLAIAAHARFLVTWETRIIELGSGQSEDALRLRALAPNLQILSPVVFAHVLQEESPAPPAAKP